MTIEEKNEKRMDVLDYMRSISHMPQKEPMQTTLSEWCEYWLKTRATNIKVSTLYSYENAVKNHIQRVFKDIKLEDVTAEDVQLFVNSLRIGYQLPKPLSPKTIKNIHGVLHKALEEAVKLKYISSNVADGTILPTIEKGTQNPLNDKQLAILFKRLEHHEKRDIFLFAIYTGLRKSEIIGLTWDCLNAEERTLNVYRQLTFNKYTHTYQFTSLKNSKSRVLVLSEQAYEILINKKKMLSDFDEKDFVFKNRENKHYSPTALHHSFKKLMQSLGLGQITFHDLRHTHAVLSLKAGMDVKTLQYNMGHYSAAFTLDVYGHCLDEMRRHGAEQFSNYMMKYK